MRVEKKYLRIVYIALLCFFTTWMFGLDFEVPTVENDVGIIFGIMENLRQSFRYDSFTMTIIFAALFYACIKIDKKKTHNMYGLYAVNAIIAILWLMSEGFRINDATTNIYCTEGQIAKSIIYVIGATHLLNVLSGLLYEFLKAKNPTMEINTKTSKIGDFYSKHSYIWWFILMFLVWIPHTIISHPASMECDAWDSLYQYFGKAPFTAHHPPVFTVLLGWFASLGLSLGDVNVGFFLWVLLQTLICTAIMAYVLYTMNKLKAPQWLIIITFLIVAISPFYNSYVTTIVKDTPYSFAVLLYMVELVYMHMDWKKYWKSLGHIFLFIMSNIAMILFRHNGKYILAIMLVYLIIRCMIRKKEYSIKGIITSIVLLVLPLLLAEGISNIVINHYGVTVQEGESMRESLSLPFQQTARYAKYYDAETPEEEKAIIDTVIDYYALASVYEPGISDPVKARFHYYATSEDWVNYFKVWFKQFLRHPMTYIEATLNQNYYLIYPQKENIRLYYSTYVDYFYDHAFQDELGAAKSMTFSRANDCRISAYKFVNKLPIIGLFSNIAVYNIIMIYLIIFSIYDKKREFLWITIPVILSDLVVVAGPAIYDNIRYALPVVYAMPLVLAYFLYVYRKSKG